MRIERNDFSDTNISLTIVSQLPLRWQRATGRHVEIGINSKVHKIIINYQEGFKKFF